MITDNIVMWVTRLSIVDRVSSETQTLLQTLRSRNQLREESHVSFGSRTFIHVSCVKNKVLSDTVAQNPRSFLWMLDYVWMVLLVLDLWDIVIEVLRSTDNKVPPKHASHQEAVPVLESKNQETNMSIEDKGLSS